MPVVGGCISGDDYWKEKVLEIVSLVHYVIRALWCGSHPVNPETLRASRVVKGTL